jgi:hypothetical protein
MLESILGPFGVGTSHGHSDSLGHTTPRAREYATTILPIVYSVTRRGGGIQMTFCPRTPGTPATLKPYNFRSRAQIDLPSEAKL